MKTVLEIEIGRGYVTKVNSDTWNRRKLGRFKLAPQVHRNGQKVYVYVNGGMNTTLHRIITGAKPGQFVDHINGDGLDNRTENLRVVTAGQNRANSRKDRDNKSGFKGVTWVKSSRKWMAQIVVNGERHYLGVFTHKERAAKAYDRAAIHYHGEHAGLNFEDLRHEYRPARLTT